MAILESVNELAKRFGVETEEQTISEQIDAINQKLDESYTGSRDIEEAVIQFAKNDGPDARLGTKTITENDTYTALDDELDGYSSVTVNVAAPTPETFEVNLAFAEDVITPDKTYAETIAAYNNGATLRINLTVQIEGTQPTTITNLGCGVYDGTIMIFFDGEESFGESVILYFVWSNPEIYYSEWVSNNIQHRKL